MMRRAAKRDLNEQVIVQAFRRLGWSVAYLSGPGCPDLLVAKAGRLVLVEVKGKRGRLTPAQIAWHAAWGIYGLEVVRSVDDVIAIDRGKSDG